MYVLYCFLLVLLLLSFYPLHPLNCFNHFPYDRLTIKTKTGDQLTKAPILALLDSLETTMAKKYRLEDLFN